MEEKKQTKIGLGAFVFLFIVLVVMIAVVSLWAVYKNI